MSSGEAESPVFDTSVAHIARVYDYWLGGKDNYPVDRVVGERVMQAYPRHRLLGPGQPGVPGPGGAIPGR
jgi:hypothetical protein